MTLIVDISGCVGAGLSCYGDFLMVLLMFAPDLSARLPYPHRLRAQSALKLSAPLIAQPLQLFLRRR